MENTNENLNLSNDNGSDEFLESKTILEHLNDLRRTLFFDVIIVAIFFVIELLFFNDYVVDFVIAPIKEQNIEIIYTNVSEAFAVKLKLAFITSVIAASPIIFISIWLFIRSALYKAERKLIAPTLIISYMLFVVGVVFAYFMVFRLAIIYLVQFGEDTATPMLAFNSYVSFLFGFLIPFGVVFELPVVIVVLTRLGIVNSDMLKTARKYIILVIFTLAAILTPPDVVSQVMLGLPMYVLFEVGVFASRLVKPREVPLLNFEE